MKSSEIIDLINHIEAGVPVEEWKVLGIRVWPLIRVRFYTSLLQSNLVDAPNAGRLHQAWLHTSKRLRGLARYCRTRILDRDRNASLRGQANVVLLSDGISYTRVENTWYEKFCDPMIDRLQERGLSTLLLSPLHEYFAPRRTPSALIQPWLDRVIIRGALEDLGPADATCELEGYSQVVAQIAHLRLPVPFPSREQTLRQALRVHRVAQFYEGLFARIAPSLAFQVSYYSTDGMAFNLACRRFGIPVADIQHGLQGDHQIAYGRWNRVPRSGFELLPSHFWVWSQEAADAIDRWSQPAGGFHRALAGGNQWLSCWQGRGAPFVEAYDRRIRELASARAPVTRHILVTLQWGLPLEEEEKILAAATDSEPGWLWWIRLHPCATNERERVRDALKKMGIKQFELDAATDFPLCALLRHMDIHVTHSSASALEARSFGIPSVVTSEYGMEFFRHQLEDEYLYSAYSCDEIRRTLRQVAITGSAAAAPGRSDSASQDRAVGALLALAGLRDPLHEHPPEANSVC